MVWHVGDLNRDQFVVNLEGGEKSCECNGLMEYEGACFYMLAVITYQGMDPEDYIDKAWIITAYRLVYSEPLYSMRIASLTPNLDTTVPAFRTQQKKRTPKNKEIRK